MKIFLLHSLLICSFLSFGQNNDIPDFNETIKTDTLPPVAKKHSVPVSTVKETAYFIDSLFVYQNTVKNFDTQNIKSVNVIKGKDTLIEGKKFSGKIYITTKNPKQHSFLTFEQIKAEFTGNTAPTIYILNGKFITDAIETYKIDKSYVMRVEGINTDSFENLKNDNLNVDIITITTKTKENVEKEKAILLKNMKK